MSQTPFFIGEPFKAKLSCTQNSELKRWLKEGKAVWTGKPDDKKELVSDFVNRTIKWTNKLEGRFTKGNPLEFDANKVRRLMYRPFLKQFYYADGALSDRLTVNHFEMFGRRLDKNNKVISFSGTGASKQFSVLAADELSGLDLLEKTQCLPLYRYDKAGNRLENVTNWGLKQFRTHYANENITRQDIFHYVYGILHNPEYRKKYELNLRREFPRIPFYEDFGRWAAWGKRLMKLHLDFETVEPYPLVRTNTPNVRNPKAKLRADKAAGEIVLDTETTLSGVPAAAWDYKLGNRSALEWVLERYKERTPKDKTVAARFNTYRFADYKEEVITLLARVCAVSVATVDMIGEMRKSE